MAPGEPYLQDIGLAVAGGVGLAEGALQVTLLVLALLGTSIQTLAHRERGIVLGHIPRLGSELRICRGGRSVQSGSEPHAALVKGQGMSEGLNSCVRARERKTVGDDSHRVDGVPAPYT